MPDVIGEQARAAPRLRVHLLPGENLLAQQVTGAAVEAGVGIVEAWGPSTLRREAVALIQGVRCAGKQVIWRVEGGLGSPDFSLLRAAGLGGVTVVMPSLHAGRFRERTGGGDPARAMCAVQEALQARLPVVIEAEPYPDEVDGWARLAADWPVRVQWRWVSPPLRTAWRAVRRTLVRAGDGEWRVPGGVGRLRTVEGGTGGEGTLTLGGDGWLGACHLHRVEARVPSGSSALEDVVREMVRLAAGHAACPPRVVGWGKEAEQG